MGALSISRRRSGPFSGAIRARAWASEAPIGPPAPPSRRSAAAKSLASGGGEDFGQDRAVEIGDCAALPHQFRACDPGNLGGKPGKSLGQNGLESFGGLRAGSREALQFGLAQGAHDSFADLEDRLAVGEETKGNDGRRTGPPERARGPNCTRLQHWLPLVLCLAYRVPRQTLRTRR